MPPPPVTLTFDFWPWNGVRVTCDVGYLCANFDLARPLCSRLRPDVRDRQTDRQTGVRQHHRLMPPLRGRGHNKAWENRRSTKSYLTVDHVASVYWATVENCRQYFFHFVQSNNNSKSYWEVTDLESYRVNKHTGRRDWRWRPQAIHALAFMTTA